MRTLNANIKSMKPELNHNGDKSAFWNFIQGMGSIFNLFPNIETRTKNYIFATDAEALASDWAVVGNDIQKAMDKFANENKA